MDEKELANEASDHSGGSPIRFQIRHLFYVTTIICALLGIPGLMYVAFMVFSPSLLISLLILAQFMFILLVPPLRRKLLHFGNVAVKRGRNEPN